MYVESFSRERIRFLKFISSVSKVHYVAHILSAHFTAVLRHKSKLWLVQTETVQIKNCIMNCNGWNGFMFGDKFMNSGGKFRGNKDVIICIAT